MAAIAATCALPVAPTGLCGECCSSAYTGAGSKCVPDTSASCAAQFVAIIADLCVPRSLCGQSTCAAAETCCGTDASGKGVCVASGRCPVTSACGACSTGVCCVDGNGVASCITSGNCPARSPPCGSVDAGCAAGQVCCGSPTAPGFMSCVTGSDSSACAGQPMPPADADAEVCQSCVRRSADVIAASAAGFNGCLATVVRKCTNGTGNATVCSACCGSAYTGAGLCVPPTPYEGSKCAAVVTGAVRAKCLPASAPVVDNGVTAFCSSCIATNTSSAACTSAVSNLCPRANAASFCSVCAYGERPACVAARAAFASWNCGSSAFVCPLNAAVTQFSPIAAPGDTMSVAITNLVGAVVVTVAFGSSQPVLVTRVSSSGSNGASTLSFAVPNLGSVSGSAQVSISDACTSALSRTFPFTFAYSVRGAAVATGISVSPTGASTAPVTLTVNVAMPYGTSAGAMPSAVTLGDVSGTVAAAASTPAGVFSYTVTFDTLPAAGSRTVTARVGDVALSAPFMVFPSVSGLSLVSISPATVVAGTTVAISVQGASAGVIPVVTIDGTTVGASVASVPTAASLFSSSISVITFVTPKLSSRTVTTSVVVVVAFGNSKVSASVSYNVYVVNPPAAVASPASGSAAGGDTVTITVTNWPEGATGAPIVTFGTQTAVVLQPMSGGTLVVQTPPMTTAGATSCSIVVGTVVVPFRFSFVASGKPSVTSVTPSRCIVGSGVTVMVVVSNLPAMPSGSVVISFNSSSSAVVSAVGAVVPPSTISFAVPAGVSAGAWMASIASIGSFPFAVDPIPMASIADVRPASAAAGTKQVFNITVVNVGVVSVAMLSRVSVSITQAAGSAPCNDVALVYTSTGKTVISATCGVPETVAATSIVVATGGAPVSFAIRVIDVAVSAITSVMPSWGLATAGAVVTLAVERFPGGRSAILSTGEVSVTVAGVAVAVASATVSSNSNGAMTTLVVRVPASAVSLSADTSVDLVVSDLLSAATASAHFMYKAVVATAAAPASSIVPASAPAGGSDGVSVVLTITNLAVASAADFTVSFNGLTLNVARVDIKLSADRVPIVVATATLPSSVRAGAVAGSVCLAGGSSVCAPFTFTYTAVQVPALLSISPSSVRVDTAAAIDITTVYMPYKAAFSSGATTPDTYVPALPTVSFAALAAPASTVSIGSWNPATSTLVVHVNLPANSLSVGTSSVIVSLGTVSVSGSITVAAVPSAAASLSMINVTSVAAAGGTRVECALTNFAPTTASMVVITLGGVLVDAATVYLAPSGMRTVLRFTTPAVPAGSAELAIGASGSNMAVHVTVTVVDVTAVTVVSVQPAYGPTGSDVQVSVSGSIPAGVAAVASMSSSTLSQRVPVIVKSFSGGVVTITVPSTATAGSYVVSLTFGSTTVAALQAFRVISGSAQSILAVSPVMGVAGKPVTVTASLAVAVSTTTQCAVSCGPATDRTGAAGVAGVLNSVVGTTVSLSLSATSAGAASCSLSCGTTDAPLTIAFMFSSPPQPTIVSIEPGVCHVGASDVLKVSVQALLLPAAASSSGGSGVTITFGDDTSVAPLSWSISTTDSSIVILAVACPTTIAAGRVPIRVTNILAPSAVAVGRVAFIAAADPTVISPPMPSSGSTAGATSVLVKISFPSAPDSLDVSSLSALCGPSGATTLVAQVASVVPLGSSQFAVTILTPAVPAAGDGSCSVSQTIGSATVTFPFSFYAAARPQVMLVPSHGSGVGGTIVTVTATQFPGLAKPEQVTVSFGGTQVVASSIVSATRAGVVFTVTTPAGAAGVTTVNVFLTADSTVTATSVFAYEAVAPPAIKSVNVSSVLVSQVPTPVRLVVTNLGRASSAADVMVLVNAVICGDACGVQVYGSSVGAMGTLVVVVLVPAQGAVGNVSIGVALRVDSSVSASISVPVVSNALVMISVQPSVARLAGGDVVVRLGNAVAASYDLSMFTVHFGTRIATVKSVTLVDPATQYVALTVTAPQSAVTGDVTVQLTCTVPSESTVTFTVSYVADDTPVLAAWTPTSGSTAGGTLVAFVIKNPPNLTVPADAFVTFGDGALQVSGVVSAVTVGAGGATRVMVIVPAYAGFGATGVSLTVGATGSTPTLLSGTFTYIAPCEYAAFCAKMGMVPATAALSSAAAALTTCDPKNCVERPPPARVVSVSPQSVPSSGATVAVKIADLPFSSSSSDLSVACGLGSGGSVSLTSWSADGAVVAITTPSVTLAAGTSTSTMSVTVTHVASLTQVTFSLTVYPAVVGDPIVAASPSTAPVAGGVDVVLTITNAPVASGAAAVLVMFGTVVTPVKSVRSSPAATKVVVTVPSGVCSDSCVVDITVTMSSVFDSAGVHRTGTFANFQLADPVLTISGISPIQVPANQATAVRVVLTGLPLSVRQLPTDSSGRFTFPGSVMFGTSGTAATVTGAVLDGNGGAVLSVNVPTLSAGSYIVSVSIPSPAPAPSVVAYGSSLLQVLGAPMATLSPTHVSAVGGDVVHVKVVNIDSISSTATFSLVMCGTAAASTGSSRANGILVVTFSAPPCAAGTNTATFGYGSSTTSAGSITYDAPEALVVPASGSVLGGVTTSVSVFIGSDVVAAAATTSSVVVTMSDSSNWAVQAVLVSSKFLTATVVTAAGAVGPASGTLTVGSVSAAFEYTFTAAPVVTLVLPSSASTGVRATVTATVTNFAVSRDVLAIVGSGVSSTAAYVTNVVRNVGSIDITLLLPASSAVGEVPVTLTSAAGVSVSFSFSFVSPKPLLQRVDPTWDGLKGGHGITVAVQNFGDGLTITDIAVSCGTAAAAVTSVAFSSAKATNFTFIAPPAPAGPGSVVCVASTAVASVSFALQYVDTSLKVVSAAGAVCSTGGGCKFSVDVIGFDEELTASGLAASFGGEFGTVSALMFVPATATVAAHSLLSLTAPAFSGSVTNASTSVVVSVSQLNGDPRVLQFPFVYEAPTAVAGAAFGPMYFNVFVRFNRPVALGGAASVTDAGSAFACAAVLDTASLLAIADGGARDNCQFTAPNVLAVSVSAGLTLVAGGTITILGGGVIVAAGVPSSLNLDLTSAAQATVLDNPNPTAMPVTISGPSSVDACRDVRLVAAAAGVGLTYSWTLSSPVDAEASAVLAAATSASVSVPASAMSLVDVKYVFAVTVTDIGGHTSSPVTLAVPRSSQPTPSLTPLDAAQVANVGQDIVVGVQATFSACGTVEELRFAWSVTSPSNSGIDLSSFTRARAVIPAASVLSYTSITVSVVATMPLSPGVSATATMTVTIARQPVSVVIAGGSAQDVVYGTAVALTAIATDPNAISGGADAYEWTCTTSDDVPCMTVDLLSMSTVPLRLGATPSVTIGAGQLQAGVYVVSVTYLKDTRAASASVKLTVVAQPPAAPVMPSFTLAQLSSVTDFSQRVFLKVTFGNVPAASSFVVSWTVSPMPNNWVDAFAPATSSLPASVSPTLAYPLGVCVHGATYTFTVTVTNNGTASMSASTTTTAAGLPTAGGCTANPTIVTALSPVDIVCDSTWTTPAWTEPLVFSFAYRYGTGDAATLIPLSGTPSTKPAITVSALPPGQVFIVITATNAINTTATATVVVQVLGQSADGTDVTTSEGASGAVGSTSDVVDTAANASDTSTQFTGITAAAETMAGAGGTVRRRLASVPSADGLMAAFGVAVSQSVLTPTTVAQPLSTLAVICQLHRSGEQLMSPVGAMQGVTLLVTLSASFGGAAMSGAAVNQVLLSMTALREIVAADPTGAIPTLATVEAQLAVVRARLAVTIAQPLVAGESRIYAFSSTTLVVVEASAGLPASLSVAGSTVGLPVVTMAAFVPARAKVVLVALSEDAVFPVGPGASGAGSQVVSLDFLVNGAPTPVTLAGSGMSFSVTVPIAMAVTAPVCRSVLVSGDALGNAGTECALASFSIAAGVATCSCSRLGMYVVVQGTPCPYGCGSQGTCDNSAGTCVCSGSYIGAQCDVLPSPCTYSAWGALGDCSAMCGTGTQTRGRNLVAGSWNVCTGTSESQDCNPVACAAAYAGAAVTADLTLTNLAVADFTGALRDAMRASIASALNVHVSSVEIVAVVGDVVAHTIVVSVRVMLPDVAAAASTLKALGVVPASSLFRCPASAQATCSSTQVTVTKSASQAPAPPAPAPGALSGFMDSMNFIYVVAGGGAFIVLCSSFVIVKFCCRKAERPAKGVSVKLAEGHTVAMVGSFRGEMKQGFVHQNPLHAKRTSAGAAL